MKTSAQVVEMSVTVTDNSPFQDYPHPDDHTTWSTVLPGSNPLLYYVENHEHLQYFGNVYCVMANHIEDQDMQANHKTTN